MTRAPQPGGRARDRAVRTARHAARRQRGIALILVLWLTVLLTVIGSSFAFSMRQEALAARNAVEMAQVRAAADGAIERTVYELMKPKTADSWKTDGAPHPYADGDVALTVYATDEAAKIDLNTAPDTLMTGLLMNVGGVDAPTAARLVDTLADWRDADDLRRPNGAEAADYAAAGLKYVPTNAPFETVSEASRVLGMPADVFARIAPSLTVYSKSRGVNPATADRTTLLALPNATAEAVDAFIAARSDALAQGMPVPPFPAASGLAGASALVWRIKATAALPDGVMFTREAVVRPSQDLRRPLIILAWLESGSEPPAMTATTTDSDARP
ncbi:MAG: general secretion pathway protein GspK [Proteobacteria bacterium]|nr:general secretion pathway protein GspK [Pseudomonadota bacterium]